MPDPKQTETRTEDFPVTVRFPIHWAEMDILGHVNNARYFTWFETVRMALFERVGIPYTGPLESGPILARAECDFLAPVVFPADIVAGTRIESLGRTSFVMGYQISRADAPEKAVARGRGVVVMVEYESGEKIPLSEELRAKLEALS